MADGMINLLLLRELEEGEGVIVRRRRYFRAREDAFNISEGEFKSLFRLSKPLARSLIESLAEVTPEGGRSSSLKVETKVSNILCL
jgi:hypothetical protein